MKKFFMAAMALIIACGVSNAAPKDNEAMAWKYAKKQAKQYQKQGWKVDGIFTLEEAFYKYRLELLKDGNRPMTGVVDGKTSAKTVNQAKQWATVNAASTYSKEAGMFMRERIVGEISVGAEDATSLDNFYNGYESLVQKEIKGELKMNFGIFREKRGAVEYTAFYIVNEDEASRARMRAMENLLKESEFARKHAEEISNFVQAGFQNALTE